MRQRFKAGNMIYPLPAALITCGRTEGEHNVFTASWTGTICTNPPMCYVSVRSERYSHDIIERNREFVINLTGRELAKAADWCGARSGRDYDKFKEMGLTKGEAEAVETVIIEESPVCVECKVREVMRLGSHDMYIADVVGVSVDEKYIDPESGKFDLARAGLVSYIHGEYFAMGEKIGGFGWSVRKKKKCGKK